MAREYDPEIKDIAKYIHDYKITSDLAVSLMLLDPIPLVNLLIN